ncbi:sigma-70 family RNA polymerase sigma factor [Piscinibacter gummiphilus]|uniref:Sigma-70 family RNA polymerase sigma factor n=1 Tax=Piscinibacter gummiphilus TaxID=946333 RepID=A0ABZ0CU03_9BURK|nr:sigma-70 family RNA polymerase sigma factor [Piscinibacter gummiphilus]WOB08452.1 sigma-70 family RNA polymerase sigma factor [Piscinibacter gummiphilus]
MNAMPTRFAPLDAPAMLFDDPEPPPDVVETEPDAERACALAASDADLAGWIGRIVEHDERALAMLYDATLSRVYGVVLRVVRRASLAEEVVEDTFFQVWRQAPRFDPARGRALTWLLNMARSRAIDAVRHEARFRHESLDAEAAAELPLEDTGHDELLDLARSHAELQRALMLLHAQPRQLVALAFFRGLSHEEIATHTALPLGTVKSQIRRALATLRETLGPKALRSMSAS